MRQALGFRRVNRGRGQEYPVEAASFRCSTHVMNLDGSGDTNLAFPPLALPFPITDDFNNNTRNVDLWSIIHEGTGGYVQWANRRLELTIYLPCRAQGGYHAMGM